MKNLLSIGSFGAKIAIVVTATVGGTALVGSSVFASLTATAFNTSAHSVSSGTLSLTQAASGLPGLTNGFTTPVTGLAPGDTINRFIDVTNGGTLAGASMTLGLTAGAITKLTSDAVNGLQVTVKECLTAYTANTGVCPGIAANETTMLAVIPANTLLGAQALTVAASDLLVGGTAHVKFIITLPNLATEVTTNGTPPGATIQGLTAALTWTFTETQRTGQNTVA